MTLKRTAVFACLTILFECGAIADDGDNAALTNHALTSGIIFGQPKTFAELLAAPPEQLEQVGIARMNLLCAEGLAGAEHLDVQKNLDTLDDWSRHVESETIRNYHRYLEHPEDYNHSEADYRMIMLATVLQEDFNVHYNPERAMPQLLGKRESNEVFFGDASDVFINGIMGEQHRGTCSSLPVLYVAVAQRLGYPVNLASTEEHLYLRYEQGTNHLNVDAAGEGFITHSDEEYKNGRTRSRIRKSKPTVTCSR